MHKLAKKTALLLTIALLLLSIAASLVPVQASTGNMHINTSTAPGVHLDVRLGITVISISFHDVDFSGGQVRLYLSKDGLASLADLDMEYGPWFSVGAIRDTTITTIKGYSVGNNWVNGTIPTTMKVAGGDYFIKGFDGATSSVAATDSVITVLPSFQVVALWDPAVDPAYGPGQTALELRAHGLPANGYANFSYNVAGWQTIADLVQADAFGFVAYPTTAPDLGQVGFTGDNPEMFTPIQFRMISSSGYTETDVFNEYARGLIKVAGVTSDTAVGLFGNNTDFASPSGPGVNKVDVTVLGSLMIVGKYFHPGQLTVLWDGITTVGQITANATGYYNITVQVPVTSMGTHNVVIDDGKILFLIMVNVIPTLILNPDIGPAGTIVTARGYGFPASPAVDGTPYNVTLNWDFVDACTLIPLDVGWVHTNSQGTFSVVFAVPHTVGGSHVVTATANDSLLTSASDIFWVTVTISVSPSVVMNDGSILTVSGSGLDILSWYDLCLDNAKNFYSANIVMGLIGEESAVTSYFRPECDGDFSLQIVVAGMQPGLHVFSLYSLPAIHKLPDLETYVLFLVTGEEESEILDALLCVNDTLAELDTFLRDDSTILHTTLTAIQEDISDAVNVLQNSIDGLSTQLTSIESLAQNAATKATEAATSAGNAASAATAAKLAAEAAQGTSSVNSTSVYIAMALSAVAAIASIIAVITLQKKVA